MKTIGMLAACIAFGCMASAHAEGVPPNPEWFICEEDHDCGRGEDVCGEPKGINLKQYKKYQKYLDEQRSKTECAPPRKVLNLRELHSICVAQHCTFNPQPDYGAN